MRKVLLLLLTHASNANRAYMTMTTTAAPLANCVCLGDMKKHQEQLNALASAQEEPSQPWGQRQHLTAVRARLADMMTTVTAPPPALTAQKDGMRTRLVPHNAAASVLQGRMQRLDRHRIPIAAHAYLDDTMTTAVLQHSV